VEYAEEKQSRNIPTIATIVRNLWTIAVSFGASLIKFVEHLSTEF